LILEHDLFRKVGNFSGLCGTFVYPARLARSLAALPHEEIAWIACHHWPLTEKPVEVRTTIEQWCEALG